MMGFDAVNGLTDADERPFTRPTPLLAEGRALAPYVTAMMDVSDGVLLDAWRMAKASGVRFAIDSASVPIAAPESRRDEALRWGEDFALLFTAPSGVELPVPATRIGTVIETGSEPLVLDNKPVDGPQGLGYQH